MNTLRRIMALVIAVGMVMGMSCTAFAESREMEKGLSSESASYGVSTECNYYLPENTDDLSQYFKFGGMGQRIDSNGYFTFSFAYSLNSSSFRPVDTTIRVYASATSSTNNKTYYISLYKSGQNSLVKKATFTANGGSQYYDFTGLSTSLSYYLKFTKSSSSTTTITGSGQVEYIQ